MRYEITTTIAATAIGCCVSYQFDRRPEQNRLQVRNRYNTPDRGRRRTDDRHAYLHYRQQAVRIFLKRFHHLGPFVAGSHQLRNSALSDRYYGKLGTGEKAVYHN